MVALCPYLIQTGIFKQDDCNISTWSRNLNNPDTIMAIFSTINTRVSDAYKNLFLSLRLSHHIVIPPLGLVPWQSPSLGYAKKGRVGMLSRRLLGYGGYSVPINEWINAGGSIDGHLPSAWRVPYKRVYLRSKAGHAIDASILMHGEGCMPLIHFWFQHFWSRVLDRKWIKCFKCL